MPLLGRQRQRTPLPGLPNVPAQEASAQVAPRAENVPPAGTTERAQRLYFSAFKKPQLTADRAILVCIGLFCVVLLQGIERIVAARNSGPQPYFIEHDPTSGAVWLSDRVSRKYSPDALNKTYFLRIWATRAWSIKPDANQTLNTDIPAAYAWTVGSAKRELDEYFDKVDRVGDRVARTPGLTREVVENSTSFSADGRTAYMLLTFVERVNGATTANERKLLTADLLLVPDKLSEDERRDNPIGLRVAHWTLTPYYGPGGTTK